MSAFAEYMHAKTDEAREEAWKGMISECRRDEYLDFKDEYEHEDYDEEDEFDE